MYTQLGTEITFNTDVTYYMYGAVFGKVNIRVTRLSFATTPRDEYSYYLGFRKEETEHGRFRTKTNTCLRLEG